MAEKMKRVLFTINSHSYFATDTEEDIEAIKHWVEKLNEEKKRLQKEYPALEKKHYENMSLLWLVSQIVTIQKELPNNDSDNLDERIQKLTEQIQKVIVEE